MSLINDMLKDLDARQISSLHTQIEPVSHFHKPSLPVSDAVHKTSIKKWLVLIGLLLLFLLWGMWQIGMWVAQNDSVVKKTPVLIQKQKNNPNTDASLEASGVQPLAIENPVIPASPVKPMPRPPVVAIDSAPVVVVHKPAEQNKKRIPVNKNETPVTEEPISAVPIFQPNWVMMPRPVTLPKWQKHQPLTHRDP